MVRFSRALFRRLACLLPLLTVAAFAQFSSGVQGNVTDPSGAAVPQVTVTLTNTATNVSRTATTDTGGVYRFTSLAPGSYTVSARATGFSQATVSFQLQTAENRDVPITLAIGDVATNVQVTTQAPLLDTSDSRLQYTFSTEALGALPLATRNPTALVGVTPGVTGALDAQQNLNNYPENFIDSSANGKGENGNLYIVDGLDVTSNVRPGVVNLTPGADAIQEVAVQTNTYSVEYGRGSGIETRMTTKSGTDQFHGFASDYYTYQGFAARGEFGPNHHDVPNTPPYHTNNAAFGVGGPIWRDKKFFFFGTYQPYHNEGSSFGPVYYEDPAFTAFAQQTRPASPEVALLTKYPVGSVAGARVFQTASDPGLNLGGACGTAATDNIPCTLPVIDTATFNSAGSTDAKQYSVRIDKDWDKDRLYGDFIRNTVSTVGTNPRPAFRTINNYYGLAFQGNETHTFGPNLLNEGIFAYNRIEGIAPASGTFSVPVVNVGGLGQGFGAGFAEGDYYQHSYHWRDVVSYIHGSHSFRFGYDGWHGDDTAIFQGPYGQPTFNYNNLIDLINDHPYNETSLSYNFLTGAPQPGNYGFSETTTAFFAQDTWKATKRLTLNYGLRYDNYGNPYPSLKGTISAPFHRGSGSTFQQQIANGFTKVQSNALNQSINWNFAPRVGAAWDITGNGNWVFNGGFGIYHDMITLGNMADILKGNPPNWTAPTFYNDGSTAPPIFGFGTKDTYPFGFPYPAYVGKPLDAKGGQVGSEISIGAVDVNVHSPTSYNWSAGIQRSLTRNVVASASYVGSHTGGILLAGLNQGANQFGYDVNAFPGDLIAHTSCAASVDPVTGQVTDNCTAFRTRLNTSFGTINYAYNTARANYYAFIFGVRGRFGHNAFLTASYTRSSAKDDATYYAPTATFDQNRFYGNSSYDFPNRFSFGGSYQVPGIHSGNGFAGRLTGGWALGGTITLQSGPPLFLHTNASYQVERINPLLPVSPSNLRYLPGSGDFSGSGYNYDLPDVNPKASISHSRRAYRNGVFPGCTNLAATCGDFTTPAFGQLGNERVTDQFRGPGFAQTDASLKKTTKIFERLDLDLRLDAFNLFNQVNFSDPNGIGILDSNFQDANFGQAYATHTARYLQIGATLTF